MKQLVLGVLVTAAISFGYRLVGTFNASAGNAPPSREAPKVIQPKNPIQPAAVRVDRNTLERQLTRTDTTGPNRTRRGEEASKRSSPVPRSVAKPIIGEPMGNLATTRTPPPSIPPGPRMVGPDGIVFHAIGRATLAVSTAKLKPPPTEVEPIVLAPVPLPPEESPAPMVRNDTSLSPEPLIPAKPGISPVRGKMIGPDGIEFHPVQRGN